MKPTTAIATGHTAALVWALTCGLVSCQSGAFGPFEGGRFGSANRFAFEPPEGFAPPPPPGANPSPNANSSELNWRPLRATFRPLNRPVAPAAPVAPQPPSLPESLALVGDESEHRDAPRPISGRSLGARLESIFGAAPVASQPATPPAVVNLDDDDDDRPTRAPMSRFRPTAAPSDELAASEPPPVAGLPAARSSHQAAALLLAAAAAAGNQSAASNQSYDISSECFECICEASTSCNGQSRCQTSDVRRTRCGLFLISYSQWLDSGLSKQLVSAEALARDVAADERAFYDCVTSRDCGQQLLVAYMAKRARDCDRDGRIDCYDVAAIHQAGVDQCNSEALLESQYWSDFNACYGFAARR